MKTFSMGKTFRPLKTTRSALCGAVTPSLAAHMKVPTFDSRGTAPDVPALVCPLPF